MPKEHVRSRDACPRPEEVRVYASGVFACCASWHDPESLRNRGVVECSAIGPDWWVNRALVQPAEARRNGLGSMLLRLACEKAVEMGASRVRVCPGGYDMAHEDQVRFYENNGFKKIEEDVWEWTPKTTSTST